MQWAFGLKYKRDTQDWNLCACAFATIHCMQRRSLVFGIQ